jgi:transposase
VSVDQQKYACGCGGCVEMTPGPERATKGGRHSLAFAVEVVIDEYLDHLPLTRHVRITKLRGLQATSQTLEISCTRSQADLCVAWEELFAAVMRTQLIGLAQTSWKRLERKTSSRGRCA